MFGWLSVQTGHKFKVLRVVLQIICSSIRGECSEHEYVLVTMVTDWLESVLCLNQCWYSGFIRASGIHFFMNHERLHCWLL